MGRKIVKAIDNEAAKKAVIWTRVSSREQEEGYSLDAQKDRSTTYCRAKGLEILAVFEIVESSTRGTREQFYEMINFVKRQKSCIALVCDKVDRLQRSFREVPVLEELRKSRKIELHFVTEGQMLNAKSNSSQIMSYQCFVMMAESYTNNISDNVCRSLEEMRKKGKWAHHAPVGYKNVRDANGNSDIVLDEDNHFIITRLFKEFSIGTYNLEQITRKAADFGLKMKTSKKLHKQTIRGILSNRFYVGEMYSGGQYYPHCYPRLTDSYTFERCQEILEGKANHKVQKHEYVFKGLVRCKNCGGVVSTDINVHSAKKKGGEKIVYKYLFCPQCGGYRTREENGVEKVKEALKTLKNMPKSVVEKLVACLDEEIYKDHKMEIEAKKALDRQIAGFAEKESRLIDLFTGGSITQDLYTKKLTEYRQDKKKLEERLTDYSHLTKQGLITLKYLAGLLLMSDQIWNFLNNDKKQQVLKLLCSEILLNGKNVDISIRKPILALAKIGSCQVWLGWLDSNQRMTIPKTVALPLGDTPRKSCFMYRCAFETAEVYLCHIFHFGKSFFITLKMPTSRVGISPKKDRPPLIRELKQPQSDSLIMIKGEHRYSDDLALTLLINHGFLSRNVNSPPQPGN